MNFSEYERNPGKKFTGIAFVIFLHVFIIYALVTGLARKVVEVIKQPIETKIIEEMKVPPPPDTPVPPPPPKLAAPPPPFIPPPEIVVQQQPPVQSTIAAVSNVKPDNPVMLPARPVTDAPPEAAPVHVSAVVDSRGCEKPHYPRVSALAEETGTVSLLFLVGVDGRVIDSKVEKSSGFKNLDNAARSALSLCKFKPGTVDGKPEQSWAKLQYVWKLE